MNDKPPYLADVQVGDKLYNFLEGNREYEVIEVNRDNSAFYGIRIRPIDCNDDLWDLYLTFNGAFDGRWRVPSLLYAPVDVLDPKNLPPRPWRPKKDEWVWARRPKTGWVLAKFVSRNPHNEDYSYWCILQEKPGKLAFSEIAPFKGELPPGLEEE